MSLPPELKNAAVEPVELTVAGLLALFGERNRDPEIVGRIDETLAESGLLCDPTLFNGNLDSPVVVRAIEEGEEHAETGTEEETLAPAALCIRDLPTAFMPEGQLVSVRPEQSLEDACTIMIERNFSQVPIMAAPSSLKGVVSWQTIALAHVRGKCESLADATEKNVPTVLLDDELLATIPDIYRNDFVFVRDADLNVCGVVTTSDLSIAFGDLTRPFLMLGEIERRLRRCVARMCPTPDELRQASGNRRAEHAEDLTVWQIQQVFDKSDRWSRLKWKMHQHHFVARLDNVRKIRNEVAHFRPSPLTEAKVKALNTFSGLMKSLMP